jgi:hypothetical protein
MTGRLRRLVIRYEPLDWITGESIRTCLRLALAWTKLDSWTVERHSETYFNEIRSQQLDRVVESERLGYAFAEVQLDSWYNDSVGPVECAECGCLVPRLAVDSHMNSAACRAQQHRNSVDDRGLVRVSTHSRPLRNRIEKHSDRGIEYYRTRSEPGHQDGRRRLRAEMFAPKNAIMSARKEYLPAPRERADRSGRIVWRSSDYCIIASNGETMDVIRVEDSDRVSRHRTLYVSEYSGDCVAYNSDGERVGEPITGVVGEIKQQAWTDDGAVVVIETGDETKERTVKLPFPVDFAKRKPSYPDEGEADTDTDEEDADPEWVPELTTAAIVPGRNVIAAANGVVVQSSS